MSDVVISGTRQISNDFRPAITNVVSNISTSYTVPIVAKSVGKNIIPTANTGMSLMEATKTGISGISKEKFDTVFNTIKKTAKQNLKKNANIAAAGTMAGKTGGKSFGKIFTNALKKVKISGKMKFVAVIAALGIAAYFYFKD